MGVKKLFKANKKNSYIIENYLYYYKTKKPDSSKETIRSKRQSLTKLANFLENKTKHKSLKTATEKDMLSFFNNRKYVPKGSFNLIGIHIIPFYRWLFNCDKHTRPKNMKWFETTSERAKRRNNDPHRKDKLLMTTEEYNKIINYSDDFYGQNKAIWETYYISGFRPEELSSMTIGDVKEDKDNVVWVACPKSKTYPREISLPEYPENLVRYIGNHPLKNNKKAPLWFAIKGSTKYEKLAIQSIRERFRKMREDLKLKSTLNIKSFRKTRATIFFSSDDPKINNDTTIGIYFGWSPSTVIYRRQEYNLTNKEDLKKAICKKPMKSVSYDTIKENLEKIKNEYEPIVKQQEKQIKELTKANKEIKNILNTNRKEYLSLKDDLNYTINYLYDIINKQLFKNDPIHRKELKKIEEKYKKSYKEGKITKEQFLELFQKETDEYYNKNATKIEFKSIYDIRKFRKITIKEKAKNIISKYN